MIERIGTILGVGSMLVMIGVGGYRIVQVWPWWAVAALIAAFTTGIIMSNGDRSAGP